MRALILVVFLAGCASAQYSPDPRIAEIQKWSQACKSMGQAISTATFLGKAGTLTEPEAVTIDKLDAIYRPVCSGDPGPMNLLLLDATIRAAVDDLCPSLIIIAEAHLTITATQIAICVAQNKLIENLQVEIQP